MSRLGDIKHNRGTSIIVHTQLDIRSLSFVAGGILPLKVQSINRLNAETTIKEVR